MWKWYVFVVVEEDIFVFLLKYPAQWRVFLFENGVKFLPKLLLFEGVLAKMKGDIFFWSEIIEIPSRWKMTGKVLSDIFGFLVVSVQFCILLTWAEEWTLANIVQLPAKGKPFLGRTSETILYLRVTAPTRCVRQDRWFQIFYIFTPIWWKLPFWRAYFSDGLVQPPTRFCNHRQLSNEKNLGWLGYIGDCTTQLYRDDFINHEIRIPINHPGFNGKWEVFFSWLI